MCVMTDQSLTTEARTVYVRQVPEDVPDNVLQATLMLPMVHRHKGDNHTG